MALGFRENKKGAPIAFFKNCKPGSLGTLVSRVPYIGKREHPGDEGDLGWAIDQKEGVKAGGRGNKVMLKVREMQLFSLNVCFLYCLIQFPLI